MRTAGRTDSEWKRVELQLDTAQILLVVAMLLGLCAASFYLGRWIERDRWQDASGRKSPSAGGAIPESDAGADLTFFDTLGGKTAEPSRQARPSPSSGSPQSVSGAAAPSGETAEGPDAGAGSPATSRDAMSAAPSGPSSSSARKSAPSGSSSKGLPAGTGSGWAIQVFAGDRAQAEKIAVSLSQKGYATRLVPGSSGPKTARVRVVGYGSRTEAQKGAERLRRESDLKPWVVKPE